MNVQLGISAINWANEGIPELGDHYTCNDILSDMSQLGYKGTEFSRKFPRDIAELKQILSEKGLCLTSQWKSVVFSDPSCRETEMEEFREHVDFLREMDCKHVVICEGGKKVTDASGTRIVPFTDEEWMHFVSGLHEAGGYCKANGMELVYHFHAETVIEKKEEIQRLADSTDPGLVSLLYDTGHAYYGGTDPLELLKDLYPRIKYIHLKDVRKNILQWQRSNHIDFNTAVVKGVFTVPGDGCIDFKPIFEELHNRGYEGWMIVEAEQDPGIADPFEYGLKAKKYLDHLMETIKR
jgi:inosose dehydratase